MDFVIYTKVPSDIIRPDAQHRIDEAARRLAYLRKAARKIKRARNIKSQYDGWSSQSIIDLCKELQKYEWGEIEWKKWIDTCRNHMVTHKAEYCEVGGAAIEVKIGNDREPAPYCKGCGYLAYDSESDCTYIWTFGRKEGTQ